MTSMSWQRRLSSGHFAARCERGPREVNADYLALQEFSYTTAIAICDGTGDDYEAATCARIGAEITAVAVAQTGRAIGGVTAAREALTDYYQEGALYAQDAAATVVTAVVTDKGIDLAWAGDSVAFALDRAGTLHTPTTPYPPLYPRPCNITAGPIHYRYIWREHPGGSTQGEVIDVERLLLCSDGLTHHVTNEQITSILLNTAGDPVAACDDLVEAVYGAKTYGNVTVAVLDLPLLPQAETTEELSVTVTGAHRPARSYLPPGQAAPATARGAAHRLRRALPIHAQG
ncbi:protein phosphatase 2C domain-containing protein (plasmid) [Streptosporangium sp. NBC_01495]|uniref:protein phosphatase 2C domain-containing protein n=1 Tax=Streptosporangium sp. NBC_01495 TaxID=2903899 RepID=UPI002E335987|nr:protein phosphatase 2C domain-containing protein [Streptosporangium sp. NBC_01495]